MPFMNERMNGRISTPTNHGSEQKRNSACRNSMRFRADFLKRKRAWFTDDKFRLAVCSFYILIAETNCSYLNISCKFVN